MNRTNRAKRYVLLVSLISLLGVSLASYAYQAPKANIAPVVDGSDQDSAWSGAQWQNIDQLILGSAPSSEDFQGRFKLVWTHKRLYLIAEIIDDVLIDTHADPLVSYWDDDTLELFIDEDQSGGEHRNNYNAMAYHVALDNQVVDIGVSGKPRLFNQHVTSVWKRSNSSPNKVIWEVSIDVYPDTLKDSYPEGQQPATPVSLHAGKKLGFMVAYCDSDGVNGREHFIGSFDIPAVDGDKNRGYIDASVFDSLVLVD